MLSISNMNSEQAANYHKAEQNYYQSENESENGEWFGKGAETLGLKNFKFEDFERLCHGIDPRSDKVLVDTSKRAGTDLTFSAPKSVSILCELLGEKNNKEIRKAHDEAVKETLKYIQDNYIQTREQIGGVRQAIDTDNMIAALFQHDTSRELDPQLHTHGFVLNMTQKENGEFRALHNEKLFDNKMLLGQVYRNYLAENLKELDYEIEVTDAKKGLFEVKGVSSELIDEFSTRAEQTKKRFEELKKEFPKMENAKLKEMAALDSRKVKNKEVNRKEVKSENIQRARGIEDIDELRKDIKSQQTEKTVLSAKEVLIRAIEIKTDRESVFSREELLKEVLKLSLGNHNLNDFLAEIEKSDELVNLDKNLYSTKKMIEIESEIVEDIRNLKGKLNAVAEFETTNNYIKDTTMTDGQKAGFNHILNSEDLVSAIQGDAGVGKTYMLKEVNNYINSLSGDKPELVGLSFTGKAASEIENEANVKSQTLHSFLNQKETSQNQIYLVDEAGMIGSVQMKELIDKAKATNSKIVLIGDTKQFQTLSAGSIFEQLQSKEIISTVKMEEGMRAKTDELKQLYSAAKNGYLATAYELLENSDSLKESDNLNEVADEYLKDKDNTLLIASKNSDRKELNSIIRENLKDELGDSKNIVIRESQNLNDIEKHFGNYYKENQVIFVQKAITGLKAGAEAEILKVDADKNTLLVKSKGKEIEIDLSKNGEKIQSFNVKQQNFGVGERIIFTKNDKKLGLKNGELGFIKSINGNNITIKKGNKEIAIDTKNYPYLDYGYAITDFKAQGQTSQNVIALADSAMSNLNSFYVSVTRAKESVKVFTDDIEKFKENSMKSQIKSSTLDYSKEELDKKIKELEESQKKSGLFKKEQLELSNLKKLQEQKEKEDIKSQTLHSKPVEKEAKTSIWDKIKSGHELYEKSKFVASMASAFAGNYKEIVDTVKKLHLAADMIKDFDMKQISSSSIEKYAALASKVLNQSKNDGISFSPLLKSVMNATKEFTKELSHKKDLEKTL